MNGTVVLGIVVIAAGIAFNTSGMLGPIDPGLAPMLILGVLIAAYGAFFTKTQHLPTAPRHIRSESDPFV